MSNRKAAVAKPAKPAKSVMAAGAVLWRPRADSAETTEDFELGLVHRPRYDDWSLPKGKLDPGETEPRAAVREVREETGFDCVLGRRLGSISYEVPQGAKRVWYWAARANSGEFVANREVDQLAWLPYDDAVARLTYDQDRKVLRRFRKYPPDTKNVIVVRHGSAGRRSRFTGDDRQRPLDKLGRAQAESLVNLLLAFGATTLYAADRLRCHQTITPLAEELGVDVHNEPTLTEEAYAADPDVTRNRLLDIAARAGTPVICSQGKVIPGLISWWCERDGVRPATKGNRKGSSWVLSLLDGRLVAADHICSPLAKLV